MSLLVAYERVGFIFPTGIKVTMYKHHGVQRLHCPGCASLQSPAECGWSSFPAQLCSVSSAVCRSNCSLKPRPCLLGAPLTSKHLQCLPTGSDCCSAACSRVSQTCSQMGLPVLKIIFFIRLGKLAASLILFGTYAAYASEA